MVEFYGIPNVEYIGGGIAVLAFFLWLLLRNRSGRVGEDIREKKEIGKIGEEQQKQIEIGKDIVKKCKQISHSISIIERNAKKLGLRALTANKSSILPMLEKTIEYLESAKARDPQFNASLKIIEENASKYLWELQTTMRSINVAEGKVSRAMGKILEEKSNIEKNLPLISADVKLREAIEKEELERVRNLEGELQRKMGS